MKKLLTLFTALVVSTSLYAQVPQAFKYQAVARDNSGNVVSNSTIGFRISLLQGSPSGTNVYSETHTVSSNNYGLVNLEIGTGSIVSGTFSSINWGNASHFIKIEMDLSVDLGHLGDSEEDKTICANLKGQRDENKRSKIKIVMQGQDTPPLVGRP